MQPLPLDLFGLARERHRQTLDDRGIMSEPSEPRANSICGRQPPMCPRLDKGMEDELPTLSGFGLTGETKG